MKKRYPVIIVLFLVKAAHGLLQSPFFTGVWAFISATDDSETPMK
jgi:hypothetical protein